MLDQMFHRKIGLRIRSLRKRHGYSQETLAEKANLSSQHIQRMEQENPGGCFVKTIRNIAGAFGMTLCQFFEDM